MIVNGGSRPGGIMKSSRQSDLCSCIAVLGGDAIGKEERNSCCCKSVCT